MLTLNPEAFDAHAVRLAEAVENGSATYYDAIVGIRRGGSIVCDAFLHHFPTRRYGARYDITLQRPSTKRKEGHFGKLLKHLPYPILDGMRIAESFMLFLLKKMKANRKTPNVAIPEGLAATLTQKRCPEILLIDDAIDSGDTLKAIIDALKIANPDATVSTAVITETTSQPRVRANYTLYRNRTLIRFPWANDYKSR